MAIIDTEGSSINLGNGGNFAYPVMPYMPYGGMGGGFGNNFGGDWAWIILLLLLAGNGSWGNGGFGGGNNMLYDINANTNRGFDQAAIVGGLNGIQGALSDASVARCNSTTTLLQAINSGFADSAMAFQSCCCDNKLGIADLKYTIATENCADRQAISDGIRDVIASNTANTQAILDKLNAQTLEAKNDEIAQLRQEVLFARGQASQIAQNDQIVNAIYNRLDQCPVGTTPVFGRTPIFTCNGGCGCGSIQ